VLWVSNLVFQVSIESASGGRAGDAGFTVSTGPNGVLGFSLTGDMIPSGSGVLTVLSFEAFEAEACIDVNDDFSYVSIDGDYDGFYSISGEGCASTGWAPPSSYIDVLYNSSAAISGFQFNVSGVELLGASGGDADAAGFTVSTGNGTVLGFDFGGSSIAAGSGTLTWF
jgi:hypothetical protein